MATKKKRPGNQGETTRGRSKGKSAGTGDSTGTRPVEKPKTTARKASGTSKPKKGKK